MRRTFLLLAAIGVALLLGTGVALAAAVSGTQGNDTLRGTRQADQIYGLNGNDTLYGRAGSDELYGGAGNDRVYGSSGADEIYGGSGQDRLFGGPDGDFINSADENPNDVVDCGAGDGARDRVVHDVGDTLKDSCTTLDDPTPVP